MQKYGVDKEECCVLWDRTGEKHTHTSRDMEAQAGALDCYADLVHSISSRAQDLILVIHYNTGLTQM